MKEPFDEDVLQRVLDGAATAADAALLREAVAADPEVRARYAQMQHLFTLLDGVEAVDPPPEYKDRLLRTLRQTEARTAADRGGLGAALASIRARLTPATAYGFAAGAVAGVALFVLFDGPSPLRLDGAAPGVMLPHSRFAAARIIDTVDLAAEGFTGKVRTRVVDGGILAEIDCQSAESATLIVEFDGNALPVLSFEQGGTMGAAALEPGRIRIEHRGSNQYWVVFGPSTTDVSTLHVKVLVGGSTLERVVRTVPADL
ncbi:MAG TPA: hypothetical protein VFD07_07370 [Candidatus Krumholzibacteria bacterium]|nr:hypothetical protein [Candidatus Krumholzibacteria bacterium]